MKEIGIVRRIDELGRIVIPIELRRSMRVKSGDEMEMYINSEGDIILGKYSKLKCINERLNDIARSAYDMGYDGVIFTNTDSVLTSITRGNLDIIGNTISKELFNKIECRRSSVLHGNDTICLYSNDSTKYKSQIISMIIRNGDLYGATIFYSRDTTLMKSDLAVADFVSTLIAVELD